MQDTAIINGRSSIGAPVPGLETICRRAIDRSRRLDQLVEMRAPEIIVRNEKRMLTLAVQDLFGEAEVQEIVGCVCAETFLAYFDYVFGTVIAWSDVSTADDSPQRRFVA